MVLDADPGHLVDDGPGAELDGARIGEVVAEELPTEGAQVVGGLVQHGGNGGGGEHVEDLDVDIGGDQWNQLFEHGP